MKKLHPKSVILAVLAITSFPMISAAEDVPHKKLVMIAGKPSHGPGMHEFNAGCELLKKCLSGVEGLEVEVHPNGWVSDDAVLDTADAVVIYADGGKKHPALEGNRPELIQKLVNRGGGVMMMHYAVQCADEGESGNDFREWIGGAYETGFSCNPYWEADYKKFDIHPITQGIKPFKILDEWYFSIRFPEDMKGVQSLLVATPSDEVRDGPYVHPKGPYEHIQARKGEPETMMWSIERPDGGRGVGFTGGHFHKNWENDSFRKIALNAMLWICKMEVPENGVESTVSAEDMAANLDDKSDPVKKANKQKK
ncbi:ThuA domain-containing protein [Luteolibacter algae]|uniref:ThuA domain-containing protein n=1 Tax=Luteolibacter algae TaxID=454151 RepID=A0ABW5DEK0_9BACT